jgi:hypothetical protein
VFGCKGILKYRVIYAGRAFTNAIERRGGGSRGAPCTECREVASRGCIRDQWERSDEELRIDDVAASEGRVFLLRGRGWGKAGGGARGVVGCMMPKASFSPALFFFFFSS